VSDLSTLLCKKCGHTEADHPTHVFCVEQMVGTEGHLYGECECHGWEATDE